MTDWAQGGQAQGGQDDPTTRFVRRSRTPAVFMAGALVGLAVAAVGLSGGSSGSSPVGVQSGLGAGAGTGVAAQGASGGPAAPLAQGSGTGALASSGGTSSSATGAAASGGGPAVAGSAAGPAGATGGTAAAGGKTAAAGPSGSSSASGSAPPGGNGGATFRGVTGNTITIGVLNLDSSTFGAACPRCGDGDGANGGADNAMIEAWKKDGQDTVYGRQIKVINIKYNVLNAEDERSACEQMAGDNPFIVVGEAFGGPIEQCLNQEHHIISVDGLATGFKAVLTQAYPYAWQVPATADTIWANFPQFLQDENLLKGQVLCMYGPDDTATGYSGAQEALNSTFRAQLHKLGYRLKVDLTYGTAPNDGLAVEQFRTNGCTVAYIVGGTTEPSGFQNVAEQQGYRPKYPIEDSSTQAFTDAVADVAFNANAEQGNVGMTAEFWKWSGRNPATPVGNPAATYCVNAYQAYEHHNLDVFNNDAEIHYLINMCAAMTVVRQALLNAGADLTATSFVQGIEQIHGLDTAHVNSVTFGPTKQAGGDLYAEVRFNKNRWAPSNDYWATTGPFQPWRV